MWAPPDLTQPTVPPAVVPFQEVWGRSYCRSMEKLVNIVSLYPNEVQYMFNPSCVALLRCTGCCGDESLHCVPVETANITMQVREGLLLMSCLPPVHTLLRGPQDLATRRDLERVGGQAKVTGLQLPPRPVLSPPSTVSLLSEPPLLLPYHLSRALLSPTAGPRYLVEDGKDLNLLGLKKSLFIPGALVP